MYTYTNYMNVAAYTNFKSVSVDALVGYVCKQWY